MRTSPGAMCAIAATMDVQIASGSGASIAVMDMSDVAIELRRWAAELGFDAVGISDGELGEHPARLQRWLAQGYHAGMDWMARHEHLRGAPARVHPGTVRVISVRMNYLTVGDAPVQVLGQPDHGYVARYALGRDYHKVMRRRLARLGQRLEALVRSAGHRACVDSAPVLEKALAERAGLGWIGKNTLLLDTRAGSFFFLGELFTSLPLPVDPPTAAGHCGSCRACIDICPTDAIVAPGVLDAGRCIAYLTIEHKGSIPAELREPIGNRIFGCDDCQLTCPWNRDPPRTSEPDYQARHGLDGASLLTLFDWDAAEFEHRTEGMALRRINYAQWRRNLAVAIGNSPPSPAAISALAGAGDRDPMVREHIQWAITRQRARLARNSDG